MGRKTENTGFTCANCDHANPAHAWGSYRNHCVHCLCSVHVDVRPGDRAADCGGLMAPTAVDYSGKKGFVLVHKCLVCGHQDRNKIAPDDNQEQLTALQSKTPLPPR